MELKLGNIDRCRKLYERYLEWSPENFYSWRNYAEFEMSLAETERARAIFQLAISQPALDMPELLWKVKIFNLIQSKEVKISQTFETIRSLNSLYCLWQTFIDFEISEGELERTRALYERLLDRTKHCKVWVSFANFEASAAEHKEDEKEEDASERKKDGIRRARGLKLHVIL